MSGASFLNLVTVVRLGCWNICDFPSAGCADFEGFSSKVPIWPEFQQKPSHDLFELNLPPAAPKADLVDFPGLPGSVD